MAGIQRRGVGWRVLFRHGGRQHSLGLGATSEAEAQAKAEQVDYLLMRLKQGLLTIPDGVGVVDYMRHDGSPPPPRADAAPIPLPTTLGGMRDRYREAHLASLIPSTVEGIDRHFRHLARLIGEGRELRSLARADLQSYVNARMGEAYRGVAVGPLTAKKEVVTLRAAWNWARREGMVDGPCPCDGLRFPRVEDRPPYLTLAEFARRSRGMDGADAARLKEAVYLTAEEVARFLAHVRAGASPPWLHPLVAAAAHAGARRAELIRAQVGDVDLDGGTIELRERKRSRTGKTTRRVPLSTDLAAVLRAWLDAHPGGPHLFRFGPEVVGRSRKRGPGKAAAVAPLTPWEIRHHFDHALAGSEWAVVPGLHTLRHSFISALASAGVDQRLIDEFAGHSTEEQRRRYRHLHPNVKADAIRGVFG